MRTIGESPSGKATGFGPVIRGFESLLPNKANEVIVGEEGFEPVAAKQDIVQQNDIDACADKCE